jgi:hypothetical protein
MEWDSIHRIKTWTEIHIHFSRGEKGTWDYDRPWLHETSKESHRSLITNAILKMAESVEGNAYLASRLKNRITIHKPIHRSKSYDDRERPHFNVIDEDGKVIHFYTTHTGRMIVMTTETTTHTFRTE